MKQLKELHYEIEYERESDGRWIAEITQMPGVMTYGATREAALAKVEALALRVLAERLEKSENKPRPISISFATA